MTDSYGVPGLNELPPERPLILRNITCAYCGAPLSEVGSTKEHVIGKRFVPRGALDRCWNLLIRVCLECNHKKSQLEDDISAITMLPDAAGKFAIDDDMLRREAERKARNSISRRTRKPVHESAERVVTKARFGTGVTINADFVGPPQLEPNRVFELARLQLMAFFYFITFKANENKGGFWRGGFFPIETVIRSDWGNPILVAFADAVSGWEHRLLALSAQGYFKAAIRRHPAAECWSWALEWNHKHRVIGLFGDREAAQKFGESLPKLEVLTIYEGHNSFLRVRRDVPLREENDKLFAFPQAQGATEPA